MEGLEEGEVPRPYRARSAEVHERRTPVVMYDETSEEGRSEESIATVAERTEVHARMVERRVHEFAVNVEVL